MTFEKSGSASASRCVTENKRVVNVVQSPALGKVVFVNIGATAVGSIKQLHKPGAEFTKGDCFGYFQFGKSRTSLAQAQCGSVLMRCCSQGVRPALCSRRRAGSSSTRTPWRLL